jgi:hypothetical protein
VGQQRQAGGKDEKGRIVVFQGKFQISSRKGFIFKGGLFSIFFKKGTGWGTGDKGGS